MYKLLLGYLFPALISLSIIPVLPVSSSSDQDVIVIKTGVAADLLDIAVLENGNMIVSGADGTMLMSTDKGTNWKKIDAGIQTNISSISFPNTKRGFAVSPAGKISQTNDGGNTWSLLTPPGEDPYFTVSFATEETGCIGTLNGKIIKTTDGGKSWKTVYTNNDQFITSVSFLNKSTGYATGGGGSAGKGYGVLLKTVDGGETWQTTGPSLNITLCAVTITKAGKIYAAGYDGNIISSDNGTNWTLQKVPAGKAYRDIVFLDDQFGAVTGDDGAAMITTDGGTSWKAAGLLIRKDFYGVRVHGKDYLLVGAEGTMIRITQ